jgi:hypothetical protein
MPDDPQKEAKRTGEETPTKKEESSKEAGAEENKAADFIEIDGLGKFSREDIRALKSAQVGLDKSIKEKDGEIEKLNEKIETLENKNLSEKERDQKAFEKMRDDIHKQQQQLIKAHITLALKERGLDIPADALNIQVDSLEKVQSAVDSFLENTPALKKAAETHTRNKEIETPERESSPGGAPPATDEEKELIDAYNRPGLTQAEKKELDKKYYALRNKKVAGRGSVV